MEKIERVIPLLEGDITGNISFINFIKNNPFTFLEIIGNCVIGKGISDHEWVYLSCSSEKELKLLLDFASSDLYFAVIEDWMFPIITGNKTLGWKLTTRRYILPDEVPVHRPTQKTTNLDLTDADFMYRNSKYKNYLSVEYIKDRIVRGKSSGIRFDNKLAAWVLTQDDGAIGFLTVLPEYRGQGFAKEIMYDIINKLRTEGEIPFAYIEDGNETAINLCEKIGFKKDRLIHWIKLAEK